MKGKQQNTWLRRLLVQLGTLMIVAALGCAGLLFISSMGGTAGNIPTEEGEPAPPPQQVADPADKTLYLTIPKLGLVDLKIHNSLSEEKLVESAIHVPETGFPWQPGANTYIAGHRLGYLGTDSWLVFFRLNELDAGDEVILKDSIGNEFLYRITQSMVIGPQQVEVMNPVEGKSVVSLQTCTLPDFSERLVVQGERVA